MVKSINIANFIFWGRKDLPILYIKSDFPILKNPQNRLSKENFICSIHTQVVLFMTKNKRKIYEDKDGRYFFTLFSA